jgi:Zn-dependent M28 family amino/carboxypeptidase
VRAISGAQKALTTDERRLVENLRRHVATVASREHNLYNTRRARSRRRYYRIYAAAAWATKQQAQAVSSSTGRKCAISRSKWPGGARAGEIVIRRAHYDSVLGAVGANDNGSGVAAVLELARLFKDAKPSRTVRLVAFVNEEPPFYRSGQMGSRVYARRSRERSDNIVRDVLTGDHRLLFERAG